MWKVPKRCLLLVVVFSIEVLLDMGWRRAPNLKCLLPGYCRIAQASCEVKRPGVEVTLLGRKEDSH